MYWSVQSFLVILTTSLLPEGARVSSLVSTLVGGPSPEGCGAGEASWPIPVVNPEGEGDYPREGVPRHGDVCTPARGGWLPKEEG